MPSASLADEFKETEIGPIPVDWDVMPLRKAAKRSKATTNPQSCPEEAFDYYSIPAYQVSDEPVLERGSEIRSQKLIVQPGMVLFGKLNPRVPKVWCVASVSPRRKIASTEFIPLIPIDGRTSGRFLYYLAWSEHVLPKSQELVSGSTPSRQRVDVKAFLNIPIPLPPLPEQRRIAHVLSTIQRAIEAQDKVIASAKELKRSLMQRLFTYGPGRERASTKETEIGEIPEHWSLVRLEQVVEVKTSTASLTSARKRHSARADDAVKVLYLKVSDFSAPMNWRLLTQSKESLLIGPADLREMNTVPPNSVVFPKRGGAIRTNKKRITAYHSLLDPNLIAVVPQAQVDFKYLFNWFERFDLASVTNDTPIPQLNKKDIEPLPFPLPPTPEQRQIADILFASDCKIEGEENRRAALQELFRSILHQLMTGRLRVKAIEV